MRTVSVISKSRKRNRLRGKTCKSAFVLQSKRRKVHGSGMDQESGNYIILPLVADTVPRPQTHGTYIWAEFDDLQKVEDRLIDGPYIHHFVEIEGDCKKEIKEFCKYFPNLKYDAKLDL